MPSFSISSYNVGRLMPSSAAAAVILPACFLSVCSTSSRSTFSRASLSVRPRTNRPSLNSRSPRSHPFSIRHDHRPFHPVLQFANVPWPAVLP